MRDAFIEHGDGPIRIHTQGDGGPYIMVIPSQVEDVRAVLDEAGITYSIDPDSIRLNDEPATTVLNFGIGADVQVIQQVLDATE